MEHLSGPGEGIATRSHRGLTAPSTRPLCRHIKAIRNGWYYAFLMIFLSDELESFIWDIFFLVFLFLVPFSKNWPNYPGRN